MFINEANNIPFETFEQLEIRTDGFIFIDYNPVAEFWVSENILNKRDDYDYIILTYKDNEALGDEIVRTIEARKERGNWWKVYGLGEFGTLEGRIYKDWRIIDELPHEAQLIRYGLNFGYSVHPLGLVAIYGHNGGFIIDEITYGIGYKNRQIADIIKNLPEGLVIADSAEPKSIDEIKEYGVNIIGATKGKDSVRHGILYIQDQRISVTKRSLNVIKEYRNYMWKEDRFGKILVPNTPDEPFHFSMDAVRYGIVGAKPDDAKDLIRQAIERDFQKRELFKERKADYGL